MKIRYKETKDSFKLRFRIKEEDGDEEVVDEITELIKILKNDNFGNAEKRKEFVKIISQIALSNDPEARRVIKALGKFMSDYKIKDIDMEVDSDGNAELEIKAKQNERNNKKDMKKKIQFKSKHMKEMYGDLIDEFGDDLGYGVEDDFDMGYEDDFGDDFEDDVVMDDELILDDEDEEMFIDDFEDEDEDFIDYETMEDDLYEEEDEIDLSI